MLKVVLDTNQFVSSFIVKKGLSAQLLQAWRKYAYVLITSKAILKEIEEVFHYPHITKKYSFKKTEIDSFIGLIEKRAIVLSDLIELDVIKDDPDDNKILACALEAKAQYIVSGDSHLLNLRQYKGIVIVTAREFLKILDSKA
ncbi:MAG: putative toxin-antitoxin system toxin component, PIN family [Candidatus Omnitrophica bacterium]|nr:putative toxin-antitoxin system toxin component, PIN family [Candidatus Omnitrophota bacterium]